MGGHLADANGNALEAPTAYPRLRLLRTLDAGFMLTIEPGIYINANVLDMLPDTPKNRAFVAACGEVIRRFHTIGVRIEDNYLVTADGVERLSDAPREAEEIEAIMAGSGERRD